jgi:hypothetical protein
LLQALLHRLPTSPTNLWGPFSRKPAACSVGRRTRVTDTLIVESDSGMSGPSPRASQTGEARLRSLLPCTFVRKPPKRRDLGGAKHDKERPQQLIEGERKVNRQSRISQCLVSKGWLMGPLLQTLMVYAYMHMQISFDIIFIRRPQKTVAIKSMIVSLLLLKLSFRTGLRAGFAFSGPSLIGHGKKENNDDAVMLFACCISP